MPRTVKQKDEVAPAPDFDGFFRLEHSRLLALAVTMVGDRDVASDVVQEALLRAYAEWEAISGLERAGAWARRVVINLCIDITRRRGRERTALALASREGVITTTDPAEAALWHAVRDLPRLQRGVVALHYVDDLSVAQVADVLGVSTGAVKTSLSRARSTLAPLLRSMTTEEVLP